MNSDSLPQKTVVPEKQFLHMPWTIIMSGFVIGFAMWSPMFCIPPIEHIIKEELLITHAQTTLLYAIPLLMVAAVAVPAGIFADRVGVKKAAGIGTIIIAIGTVLRGTTTDYASLLAFTIIYGIGFGFCFPNMPKLVSAWVPREKAGVAVGLVNSGMPTGAALALAITVPLVLPITNTFQGVFFIWSIPNIVAAILCWTLVKEPPVSRTESEPITQDAGKSYRVLTNKNLWLVAVLLMLNEFFILNFYAWSPSLLRLKGATDSLAGLITSVAIWMEIPTFILMPRLSHRLGLRKPFLWIPGITLALIAWGLLHISVPVSWVFMVLAGVANVTRFITIFALPIEMVPKEHVGKASGLMLSIGYMGGGLGPLMGGHILDLTGSLNLSYLILVGISIAATAVAFRLPETGPKAGSKSE